MGIWKVVTSFRTPWAWIHSILSNHAPTLIPVPHRIIDHSIAYTKAPSAASTKQARLRLQTASRLRQLFYPGGFGDVELPSRFYERLKGLRDQVTRIEEARQQEHEDSSTKCSTSVSDMMEEAVRDGIPALDVTLEKAKYNSTHDCFVQLGHFPTIPDVKSELPEESHTGYFQLVLPASWYEDSQHKVHPPTGFANFAFSNESHLSEKEIQYIRQKRHGNKAKSTRFSADKECKPVVIILPGTGEHGFSRRGELLAFPLAEEGVASVILESPFYGLRKPKGQRGSKLKYLSDLPALGRATVEETRSLVRWIRDYTTFGPIVLTGTSMGGLHAAITASLTPVEVGVVSWLGPTSAAPVFTHGALSGSVDWMAMCKDVTDNKVDLDAEYPPEYIDRLAFNSENRIEKGLRSYEKMVIDDMRSFIRRQDVEIPHQLRVMADQELDKASERLEEPDAQTPLPNGGGSTPVPAMDRAIKIAQHQITRFLHLTNVLHVPPPLKPQAVTFVAALYDQYVPPPLQEEEWQALLKRWDGAKMRWMTGGHVSATLWPLESENQKSSILCCIEDLRS
eukprot:gb/GECG01005646.1/.p1 GENE.gb/GECG01005646.1/~~gb/GECG01005646.1/.p1  ORF type:complete len:566 (+),score=59.74 gb/GECG01005646.1/:1-1698(+)